MPKITNAFLTEVAAGLYHSVSHERARQMALELTENKVSREWAMKMAQELIEARNKKGSRRSRSRKLPSRSHESPSANMRS